MLLEEVVRRNRRRIAVLTALAMVNYIVLLSLIVGYFGWGLYFDIGPDHEVTGATVLFWSVLGGTLGAALVVATRIRGVRPRTTRVLGAVDVEPGEVPVLDNLLAGLALAVGTPPVRAALLADDTPNALAVGRSPQDTTIVVTSGLLQSLSRDELEAVLAVEMCAVRRLDVALQSTVLVCTSSAIGIHRSQRDEWKDPRMWPAIVVTWPMMAVAEVIRQWTLRSCDFGADEMAVRITRNPEALRRALAKLRDDPTTVDALTPQTALLWFEPLPHGERRADEFRGWALTPTLDERIARLPAVPST